MDTATRNWINTGVGALLAVGIGAAGLFGYGHASQDLDVAFVISGLAALGLHVALTTNTAASAAATAVAAVATPPPDFTKSA